MAARHRSRQRALQILYQWDLRKMPLEEAMDSFYNGLYAGDVDPAVVLDPAKRMPRDRFMEELAKGAVQKAGEIDRHITQHSEHWRLERMPAVDRNILRLAIYEMIESTTPAAVVIDEALELARRFAGDESVPFINGVLDAVRRDIRQA